MDRLVLALASALAGCAPGAASDPPADGGGLGAPPDAISDAASTADAAADAAAAVDPAPLVAELGPALEAATGGDVALAVVHLETGARASYAGNELHISASSAKAFWVAAALDGAGVAAVEPHAEPIFADSDNDAAGEVIDLIGPDAVNVFLWERAGMDDTALTTWSFGKVRVASNSPRRLGDNNYFTAEDSIAFLDLLWRGELLGAEETAALLGWLKLSPRDGFGGWSGDRLPEPARSGVRHKAGWLPPGCCSQPYHTLVDIGIVETGAGAYAYALLFRYGDWEAEQAAMSRASCRIYRLIAGDPALDCRAQVPQ